MDKMKMDLSHFNEKLKEYKDVLRCLLKDEETRMTLRHRLSKLSERRSLSRNKLNAICCCCQNKVELDNINSFVTCKGCNRPACRQQKCSDWIASLNVWQCKICLDNHVIQQKAGEWLLHQLNLRFRNPSECAANRNSGDASGNDPAAITGEQREKVREFMEEILANMLNGSLEDVTIGKLYNDKEYLPLWEHECPGVEHVELKKNIEKLVNDVIKLPQMLSSDMQERQEDHSTYFDPKKYEQLLATATLNKVVDYYQNKKNIHDPEVYKKNVTDNGALNSHEPIAARRQMSQNNDSDPMNLYGRSVSDTEESYLSDYIQNHKVPLPDFSNDSTSPDDDMQSVTSNGTDGTWEENWLFKKKKLQTEIVPSIAMLIPSPTEEVKALIGDQNADEVSDLSEAGSDEETESLLVKEVPINDMLGPDSLVSNQSLRSNEPLLTEAKNNLILIEADDEQRESEQPATEFTLEQLAYTTPMPRNYQADAKPVAAPRSEKSFEVVNYPADNLVELDKNTNTNQSNYFKDTNNIFEDEHLSLTENEIYKELFPETKVESDVNKVTETSAPQSENLNVISDKVEEKGAATIAAEKPQAMARTLSTDPSENVVNPQFKLGESSEKYDSISDDSLDKYVMQRPRVEIDFDSIGDKGNDTDNDTDTSLLLVDPRGLSAERSKDTLDVVNEHSFVDSLNASPFQADSLLEAKSFGAMESDSIDKQLIDKVKDSAMTQDSLTLTDELSASDDGLQFSDNSFGEKNTDVLLQHEEKVIDKVSSEEIKPMIKPIVVVPIATESIVDQKDMIENRNPFANPSNEELLSKELGEEIQPLMESNPFADDTPATNEVNNNSNADSLIDLKSYSPDVSARTFTVPQLPEVNENPITETRNILNLDSEVESSVSSSDISSPQNTISEIPKLDMDFSDTHFTDDLTTSSFTDALQNDSTTESLVDLQFDSPKESLIDSTSLSLVENSQAVPELQHDDGPEMSLKSQQLISRPTWFKSNSFTEHVNEESDNDTENSLLISESTAPFTSLPGEAFANRPEPVAPQTAPESAEDTIKSKLQNLQSSFDDVQAEIDKLNETTGDDGQGEAKEEECSENKLPLPLSAETPTTPTSYELVMNLMRSNSNKKVSEPELEAKSDVMNDSETKEDDETETNHANVEQKQRLEDTIAPSVEEKTILNSAEIIAEEKTELIETEVTKIEPLSTVEEKQVPDECLKSNEIIPAAKELQDNSQETIVEPTKEDNESAEIKPTADVKDNPSKVIEEDQPKVTVVDTPTLIEIKESADSEDDLPQIQLIPGSIAEREHLKWTTAAPLANNPYSAEALKRRLGEPEANHNKIDIEKLVENQKKEEIAKVAKPEEQTLQAALASLPEQPEHKKYGRDYYINEAKRASGARKKTHPQLSPSPSTDEEKILNLNDKDGIVENSSNPAEITTTQYQRSHSFGDNKFLNDSAENIFAARPIHVDENNPILKNAKKLPYLSTDERDFYLLPLEEQHPHSSDNSISTLNDSLTYSEDSDSTRVYNLNTCKTEILKDSLVETKLSMQLPENQINIDQNNNSHISASESKAEPSPASKSKIAELVINLQDKVKADKTMVAKKPVFTGKITKMNEDYVNEFFEVKPETPSTLDANNNSNGVSDKDEAHEKTVIEEDVIASLPSVKKLAQRYTTSANDENNNLGPIVKPKSFIRQPSVESNTSDNKMTEPSTDSFVPPYNYNNYLPMAPGHSITARSISKQFRDELKITTKSSNDADANVNVNNATAVNENEQNNNNNGHRTPERAPSPVLVPGKLKTTLAFFENLKPK